ncbi:hypothetical protein EUGRSUZ_D01373 [Eucalyptus grandis]|uniref:Uncharacterized protein n=2 Tax=Eucalyptus grandis TaxID=71139 RepID=A0ACC3L649_EUCGR|nr:hypothetical protein EUGRSUZ_D01373 [Eucalyptus grandis]
MIMLQPSQITRYLIMSSENRTCIGKIHKKVLLGESGNGGGGRARTRPVSFWVSAITEEAQAEKVRAWDAATTGRALRSE